ncbi:hypothetical protein ACFT38_30745 [Streptomyces sp. NPDC056975]|uniref:hypothetical protein n=1 Tax=Streptomyces sp. NPDC056975 TaxID=3345985 RepID=UPI003626A96F
MSCQRLAEELSRHSVPDIIGFARRRAEALCHLDQENFDNIPVVDLARNGSPFPAVGILDFEERYFLTG